MVAYFNAWPIFCHKVALVACFLACLEELPAVHSVWAGDAELLLSAL